MCGNWGKCPKELKLRDYIRDALKKNSAQVVALAECQAPTADILSSDASAGDDTAVAGTLAHGSGYKYLTLRANEDATLLIAVREAMGNRLHMLHWVRRAEGEYRTKNKKPHRKSVAYSRILIAKVDLDTAVGFIGNTHNVMPVHMHHHLANAKWPA